MCQKWSNYWREWFGLPTHGAVFPAYPPANQNPSNEGASSRTSTSGPSTSQQMSPTSQQIQFDFAVDVAFLFSLIDQNPDQNAELIRLLNTSTSGNVNDLNGENLDREVLSNLSAHYSFGHCVKYFGSKPCCESGNSR